ncbi:MAG: Hsp70 family protein [Candidatus Nitrosocosmicus sp.]|nr:Hsp70 family protein [Candidatus Nitrosocosmicus sp.]MDN5866836.1 Hsp70 family protein [Candidatus Nitrosocosmicus sp.]
MEKILGIDLGTTNSSAAMLRGGRPELTEAAEGKSIGGGKAFPTIVSFDKNGNTIVGMLARKLLISNPEGCVTAAKRKMGTDFKYEIYGKSYTPQQISAILLKKIKDDTESYFGIKVDKAVITVPAYFNDNQRQATKDAGKIAGLDVVRIINEPTAAALAYGLDKTEEDLKIMVFDFGGGTLDVVILEMGNGIFHVKSVAGDTALGGTDIDTILVNSIVEEFQRETGIDLRTDQKAMVRVIEDAEKAKIELSFIDSTEVNIPFITFDKSSGQPKNLNIPFTRSKLEELVNPIVERCREPIIQALNDAQLNPSQIDKILLIGGPTKMPLIKQFIKSIIGKDPELGVDPSDTVAIGAAIMGTILTGEMTQDIQLVDVTPLTLGIELVGGVTEPLIERNSIIPTTKSKIVTTVEDSQNIVRIHIVQGEQPMAVDCVSLGSFILPDIPPEKKGVPQIEVTFEIDVDGILNVTAKDLATFREKSIQIDTSTKLTSTEIESFKSQMK